MSLELNGVATWMYSRLLSSDIIANTVRVHPTEHVPQIYEMQAILNAELPYILFIRKAGYNINGSAARRIFEKSTYDIKVVFSGNDFTGTLRPQRDPTTYQIIKDTNGNDVMEWVDLVSVGNEIDRLFHQAQDLDDPIVAGARAISAIQRPYVDPSDGKSYKELGATFEVMAYKVS